MKNFMIFLFAIILFIPFLSADAQFSRKDIDDDNIGDRLGNEIEQLIDRIGWQWNFDNDFEQDAEEDTLPPQSQRSHDFDDIETDENTQIFSSDKIVQESDTINGNVVVKGGNLTVYGVINGDVQVVGGDLHLRRTGKITGNTRVIDGSISKEEGAVIKGYEEKTSTEKADYRETKKSSQSSHAFDVLWRSEQTTWDHFIFRYNRVESIFVGLGTEKKFYWDGEKVWNAYGSIGWGFKSHIWRGNLGLIRQFAIPSDEGSSIIELGAEGYTLTDTKDQWIISQNENTAAALLIHEDFRNYFERKGFTIHTAFYTKQNYLKGELKLAYLADTYDSLSNKIDWAFFGGHKKFRANNDPPIDPGKMRSVMLNGGISTITKTSRAQEGWCLFGSAEFARKNWGSEFDFDQYLIDLRRFQPLGRYENFNMRVRVGTSSGILPIQREYELGGLGTMNAFPFKSDIHGNRMLLVNMEFILNGNVLNDLDFWPTWIFQHVNIILTSDAGFTRSVLSSDGATEGFGGIKLNEFRHNFGVAVGNRIGTYRIGIAWRTDKSAPLQFILRFSRPF